MEFIQLETPRRGDKKNQKTYPLKKYSFLNDSINTIPKLLKSKGFVTANFGKWHINKDPLSHGFDFNIGGVTREILVKTVIFLHIKLILLKAILMVST